MIKRKTILYFLLLSVGCMVYTACKKTDTASGRNPCLEPRRYFLTMQSCAASDTGSAGSELKLPSPVVGYVDTPIGWANGKTAASNFTGPLSSVADSTRWFILPDTNHLAEIDTIVFYYERKPIFLSTACGYTIAYSLQKIAATNHIIDSARIEKSEVNGAKDIIHVKVFY